MGILAGGPRNRSIAQPLHVLVSDFGASTLVASTLGTLGMFQISYDWAWTPGIVEVPDLAIATWTGSHGGYR